ncbi:MAG: hypothetical protein VCE75_13350 [Alphaproteobacteria bacterium]
MAAAETREELRAEPEDQETRWLYIVDAAAVLGISDGAPRLRMSQQTISSRVDGNGRVDVRISYDLTRYMRDSVTMPETPEETPAKLAPPSHAPASQDRSGGNIPDEDFYEIRIDELKVSHAAEIYRMMGNHRGEVARLVELHQATAKLESENKEILLSVISSLSGCK